MLVKPLSLSLITLLGSISTTAQATPPSLLDSIIIEDNLEITPNHSEANQYQQNRAITSDGGEFLTEVNGVSMSRFGGRGIEPIIRGQSQTRLNVKLDGAFVHGGCPNRMDPPTSWAAMETYESVRILKGVQTLVEGAGGSGGTVLFERNTRSLAEDTGVHGRVSASASNNQIKSDLLADIVASSEKAYVRGIAQHKKADNYTDGDGNEVRSSFKHQQAGIILGYTPTEDRLLEISLEKNDFSDALYPGSGMDSPTEEGNISRLKYTDKPSIKAIDEIKLDLGYSDISHVMNNFSLRTPPLGTPKLETPTTSKTHTAKLQLTSPVNPRTKITYGIDLQNNNRDAVMNNESLGGRSVTLLWPDIAINQTGIFAEASHALPNKQNLKVGLRIDHVTTSHDKANTPSQLMGGRTANQSYAYYYGNLAEDKTETNIGGLLRYEKKLNKGLSFYTGLSRSVRTADATERGINKWVADSTSRWIGNPDIKPEKHHQLDIGFAKSSDAFKFSGSIFYDHVNDYILRDVARGQSGVNTNDQADIYRNVDAKLYGLELEASKAITKRLSLSASIATVRATNTTDNRHIAQTPPDNGKLQLDFKANQKWAAGGRVRFANHQNKIDDLSRQEVGRTAGHAVLDLYGNYQLNSSLNLRFGVDNVLDKTYANHASRSNLLDSDSFKVNEPGRTAWLKVVAEF